MVNKNQDIPTIRYIKTEIHAVGVIGPYSNLLEGVI